MAGLIPGRRQTSRTEEEVLALLNAPREEYIPSDIIAPAIETDDIADALAQTNLLDFAAPDWPNRVATTSDVELTPEAPATGLAEGRETAGTVLEVANERPTYTELPRTESTDELIEEVEKTGIENPRDRLGGYEGEFGEPANAGQLRTPPETGLAEGRDTAGEYYTLLTEPTDEGPEYPNPYAAEAAGMARHRRPRFVRRRPSIAAPLGQRGALAATPRSLLSEKLGQGRRGLKSKLGR